MQAIIAPEMKMRTASLSQCCPTCYCNFGALAEAVLELSGGRHLSGADRGLVALGGGTVVGVPSPSSSSRSGALGCAELFKWLQLLPRS